VINGSTLLPTHGCLLLSGMPEFSKISSWVDRHDAGRIGNLSFSCLAAGNQACYPMASPMASVPCGGETGWCAYFLKRGFCETSNTDSHS